MSDALPLSPIRCAIYTRKSRELTGDYSSCEAQFDACFDFLRRPECGGWIWNGSRYDDEGESGVDRNRPGLTRLLADIAAGQVDRVVVYRLDRLARRLAHCAAILQEFREHDVAFTVITSPELGDSAQDSLVLNILSSFAEFELELTRERLRDSRVSYKQRGLRIAGVVPFGYATDAHSKHLVLVDEEARQLLEIFRMIAAGQTPSHVAAIINQQGWRTKERLSRRSGRRSGGNPWTARQVLATI